MSDVTSKIAEAVDAAADFASHEPSRALSAKLLADIHLGLISPATTWRSFKRAYAGEDEGTLLVAMRQACRWHSAIYGGVVVVSDGDSGEIIEQYDLPLSDNGYGGRSPEGLGLSAMTQMLDHNVSYFEARDFLLHVHIMPKARYRKRQGRHVAVLGELLLTYKGWDLEPEDVDAPFPDDMPLLDRQVCYQYSPRRGYIGFDGERWRYDW